MKKTILAVASLATLICVACNSNSTTKTQSDNATVTESVASEHHTVADSTIWGIYEGELPAADGGAFATRLEVRADGLFRLEQKATADEQAEPSVTEGTYTYEEGKILFSSDFLKSAVVEGNTLTYLDADGKEAKLYRLEKVKMSCH